MMEKDFRMRTFKDGISVIGESFPGFWGVRWRGCGAAFMGLRVSFCSGWGCCASIAFMGLFIAFYRGLGWWAPVAMPLVGFGVCLVGWPGWPARGRGVFSLLGGERGPRMGGRLRVSQMTIGTPIILFLEKGFQIMPLKLSVFLLVALIKLTSK